MPIAHPLVGSPPLPVPPLVLAAVAVVLAAVVATRLPSRPAPHGRPVREPRWFAATRLLSALLLAGLVVVARAGPPDEPRNLAAVAVVHLVWPLLLVASVVAGPALWRAVDPWRALGAVERLFGAPPPARLPPRRGPDPSRDFGDAAGDVRPGGAGADGPAGAPGGGAAAPAADVREGPAAALVAEPAFDAREGPAAAPAADAREGPAAAPAADAREGPAAAPAAETPGQPGGPAVWPAVVTGAGWAVFLGWSAVSVPPRALAAALAAYAVVLVAGCVALGRERWLAAADAVGLVVSWAGLLRRGALRAWSPPSGAAALLGAVFGGVLFVRVRVSGLWGDLALRPDAERMQRAGAVLAVLLCAGLAEAARRWAARRGAPGSVAAALVPVVAATAVATVLRRAMVAAQLVPSLLADPFEKGWRLLGPLGTPPAVDVNPWGTAVQQGLAVAVVALGGLAGAWVVARRVRGVRARDPAALAVYVTTFAAVLVLASR